MGKKQMNIFYLDKDPVIAAQLSCDKHVVKMILESAQMLCTVKRVLDGTEYTDLTKNGEKLKDGDQIILIQNKQYTKQVG